jgi:hypothetical protein
MGKATSLFKNNPFLGCFKMVAAMSKCGVVQRYCSINPHYPAACYTPPKTLCELREKVEQVLALCPALTVQQARLMATLYSMGEIREKLQKRGMIP